MNTMEIIGWIALAVVAVAVCGYFAFKWWFSGLPF